MLVVVAGVLGVAVSIMYVIGVVAVPNRFVSAGLTMAVLAMLGMFAMATALAFVPVGFVFAVSVTVMEVVNVPRVLNRCVAALGVVLVAGVSGVLVVFALVHGW